ncbi:LCP family protein [Clostridium ganghwense]|uniref:LCP family protein n=1 Tax=Clostridium ganghwense TaxID=312089 RepID=A0ABT4CQR9_9CLOT|nr:LCP family protein [Clostridium ganghwense]MCY6371410.1 LCP family protein [Clostridium ganghwense]
MAKYKKPIKITIILILISIISVISYFIYSFEKNSHITTENSTILESELEEDMPELKEVDGITNILLLGSDARTLDEKSRSDAIMILTIDDIHKKLKLTSILRDSYVKIPGHGEQKINHAFVYGGPDLLVKTIESNFSIKLDKYAIINFSGFQDLIDSIGGLDINVKPKEVAEINKYIQEVNGNNSHLLKGPGLQHLDGQQALSYSRIRHVGNGSYERTERQRHVISLIVDKLKDTPMIKYPVVTSNLIPYIKTNMDITEIMNYAYTIYEINNFNLEQLQMPLTELSYGQIYGDKGWILLMDKPQNAKILNDFIFDDKTYTKSDLDYASYKRTINTYLAKIKKQNHDKKTVPPKIENESEAPNNSNNNYNDTNNDIINPPSTNESNQEDNTDNTIHNNIDNNIDNNSDNNSDNNDTNDSDTTNTDDDTTTDIDDNDDVVVDDSNNNNSETEPTNEEDITNGNENTSNKKVTEDIPEKSENTKNASDINDLSEDENSSMTSDPSNTEDTNTD